jgi:LacI family transcriptional regulator
VRVAAVDIGIAGARILLDRIADPSAPPRRETLAPTLIVRASCGADLRSSPPSRRSKT